MQLTLSFITIVFTLRVISNRSVKFGFHKGDVIIDRAHRDP